MSSSEPAAFSCPLSLKVMDDPVLDKCAHCFERDAILEWLRQGHGCCPISRKPLTASDLTTNQLLSDQIEAWKQRETGRDNCKEVRFSIEKIIPVEESDGIVSNAEQGRMRKIRRKRSKYQQVPVSAKMFLPQELRAMELAKTRAASELSAWRRRVCFLATKIVVLLLLTATSGCVVMWKLLYQE